MAPSRAMGGKPLTASGGREGRTRTSPEPEDLPRHVSRPPSRLVASGDRGAGDDRGALPGRGLPGSILRVGHDPWPPGPSRAHRDARVAPGDRKVFT